jgi:hypothetical protein
VRLEIETDFPELTMCDCSICRRVTRDHLGINVCCLRDFEPDGIPVRRAAGAAMP